MVNKTKAQPDTGDDRDWQALQVTSKEPKDSNIKGCKPAFSLKTYIGQMQPIHTCQVVPREFM